MVSRSEQTFEYTPPEALLNASWFQGPKSVTLKFATFLSFFNILILENPMGQIYIVNSSEIYSSFMSFALSIAVDVLSSHAC